ncbi:hypothetical protein GYH30_006154 [Glycine max]|nr:hypothetical protein GYH30_006154 [Glycine max]KAH1068477.1 hypothetical protein GYH30_006154 [Glycine max]
MVHVLCRMRSENPCSLCIQVVSHITAAIKDWIEGVVIPVDGKEGPADVCVIELGGTVDHMHSSFIPCNCTFGRIILFPYDPDTKGYHNLRLRLGELSFLGRLFLLWY